MEGWRQRRLGSKAKNPHSKNKTILTLTGLLMEGVTLSGEYALDTELASQKNLPMDAGKAKYLAELIGFSFLMLCAELEEDIAGLIKRMKGWFR